MISGGGTRKIFADEPSLVNDPRFKLYPEWIQQQTKGFVGAPTGGVGPGGGGDPTGGAGKMVIDIMKAGGLVVTGTDGPNAVNLHGEMMAYTMAGMSAFDALKAATVNPGKALNVDTGTIEPGKLADIVMIEGDPLANIANTKNVRRVIANGRVYEMNQLLGSAPTRSTAAQ
jgi:hypothetical protein